MRIQYKPVHRIPEVVHVNSVALERMYGTAISHWRYGEVKNVPDDLRFRSGDRYISLIEDLLSNSAFNPAGKSNPNFTCSRCGDHTEQEFVIDQSDRYQDRAVPLQINNERVCHKCFKRKSNEGYQPL